MASAKKTASKVGSQKVWKYGRAPFGVAVIHGGPGAAGEMAPVAQELSTDRGILEPFQSEVSIQGQICELKDILCEQGSFPVTLIGFSWGAWLSLMVAARYPAYIKKLILIGSGPYEEKYAAQVQKTRLSRLSKKDKLGFSALDKRNGPEIERLGVLLSKADAYAPITKEPHTAVFRPDIFQSVWPEAVKARRSGRLLKCAKLIKCPVVAIHGDYDPHPAEGVKKPLSRAIRSFRFLLLENCGHKPWIERWAKEKFYRILKKEVK